MHPLAMICVGRGAKSVTVPGGTASNPFIQEPSSATVSVRFNPDGTVDKNENDGQGFVFWHNWHVDAPISSGSDYQLMASVSDGTTPTLNPGMDQLLSLGSALTLTNVRSSAGTQTSTLSILIQEALRPSNRDTGTYVITATVSPANGD